jgi:putative glutamine amidotransferase
MVRPVISNYQQLNQYEPRIAVIEDTASPASKKVLEIIKNVGGKSMIIPRFLSDRLLASQGLTKPEINRIKRAANADEVREFEQQISAATRLHLQYITRKLTFVDAVVLPGNQYDIPPSAYHDIAVDAHTRVAPPIDVRFQTELMMAEYALHTRKIPILGISGGMQLLVVKTGGKLVQHLPSFDKFEKQLLETVSTVSAAKANTPLSLEKLSLRNEKVVSELSPHFKVVQPRSILGVMLATSDFEQRAAEYGAVHLNHQGVRPQDVNQSEMKVTALTSDGAYVEAIEHAYHPMCIGIQFHPEYHNDLGMRMIKEVVDYARTLKSGSFDAKAKVPSYIDLHEQDLAPRVITAQASNAARLELIQ